MMNIFRRGKIKRHIGCGGKVRYVESLDPSGWSDWELECLWCGEFILEDNVEIVEVADDV